MTQSFRRRRLRYLSMRSSYGAFWLSTVLAVLLHRTYESYANGHQMLLAHAAGTVSALFALAMVLYGFPWVMRLVEDCYHIIFKREDQA